MNHYEERKQARIDYYNEKAAVAAKKSGELVKQSNAMMSVIPFGQPILVGHHSEQRDRNYRGSAHNKMAQGMKEADKAGYYAAKAEAAENNNAISSDDPEAVTKLETKLTALKAGQGEMKKANAYYRKHKTMKGYARLSDDESAATDTRIGRSYSWQKQPYPSYLLQNNNANIRRISKRIEELKSKAAFVESLAVRGALPSEDGWEFDNGNMSGRVEMNTDYNRIQIYFDAKPDEDIRRELKSRGFKWAPSQGAWQRQLNGNGLYAIRQIQCVQPAYRERDDVTYG